MTFDLISGLHMQIQTWHPPLWFCTHAKYYVKSGLTNVLKNDNNTKNMHLFSIRIANYIDSWSLLSFLLLLSVTVDTDYFHNCFRQKSVNLSLAKTTFTFNMAVVLAEV